jgi:glutaredoxin 1
MKIEIYGAEWCNFCVQAKTLCETSKLDFDYIDIDDTSNMQLLEERVGGKVKTVPQIFMDGMLVPGGFTGLKQELEKI